MFPLRQIFLVVGLSESGRAAAEFLLAKKATVYLYDDNETEAVRRVRERLLAQGAKFVEASAVERAAELCDALVLSPGVPIDHPLAVACKRKGKAIIGETELAARYLRCPCIAVTGTNGKTTTVSMLTSVLQKGGYKATACGNIGTPLITCDDGGEEAVAVAEISSFQLETLRSLRPHIALILNVTEDHLNRHYTMDNYIYLKRSLLRNSTEAEYAVLNYDDEIVRGFAESTSAKTFFFSVRQRVRGAYCEDGWLWFEKEKIMPTDALSVEGVHNVQNALAAIVAAKLMGIKNTDVADALAEFKGARHRMELVGEANGVRFIDDSKGTNVAATLRAIDAAVADTVLLLGGKNKGYDYKALFLALPKSRVVHAVLYGENRYALLQSARECSYAQVTVCGDFSFAVRVAAMRAKKGENVLLSPASASFDEFANYGERGDRFVEIVREIQRETQVAAGDGADGEDGIADEASDEEEAE